MKKKYFLGVEVSPTGQKHGKVDYKTLSHTFNSILCNCLAMEEYGYLTVVNGEQLYEDECTEVFQYYLIDDVGYQVLKKYTNEIVFYDEKLDIYIWGITHYGTAWDCVLTDIDIPE